MGKPLPSRADILDSLADARRPVPFDVLAKRLKVGRDQIEGFSRFVDNLVFQGALLVDDHDNVRLASNSGGGESAGLAKGEREGTIAINPRGFGFVSSPTAAGDDVFIPAESLNGAMHGDTVIVRVRAKSARGSEGDIVKIVQRGTVRVAGILRRRGKSAWLEPDDTRVRGPIVLKSDMDVKSEEGNNGKDGDCAVVRITRFPERNDENPEGTLEAVLGKPGELKVEVAKILVLAQIDELHSAEAVTEAEAYGKEVPVEMLEGREDLTHLPLPTIDPEDARDHDDAVWVERSGSGYKAWIAIADVSSYVRPGTHIDDEAKKRGCSIYLPDRAIPMLPRALSSNLCSLLPDVIRLCLCVEVELDEEATIKKTRLIRGFMKSRAKLSYGSVARALGFTEAPPRDPKADAMVEDLKIANELSRKLRAKRMARGALDFDLPEAKLILGEDGLPTGISKRSQDAGMKKAYQLIEELMLLGNEVVATWLVEGELPGIFRVHLPPDEKKLTKLSAMCELLGVEFDLDSTKDPKALGELLKKFAKHPLSNVLNNLLLRSMKQATYDIANLGHFGLASQAYLHFTSPIRRYPDLCVHRTVHAAVQKQRIDKSGAAKEELASSATASSLAERRAMEIEREVVDLYRAIYMRDKLGERYIGKVNAIVGSGVFISLDEPFLDVLVKLEDLGMDRFEVDDDGLRVVAPKSGEAIQLGDEMVVEIIDVQILRRTVYGRRISSLDDDSPRRPRDTRQVGSRDGGHDRPTRNARPSKGFPEARGGGNDRGGRKNDRDRKGRGNDPKGGRGRDAGRPSKPGKSPKQKGPKGKKKGKRR